MWISAHSTSPIVYDPKSGIEITDFVQIQDESSNRAWDQIYKHFLYVSESDEVIGVTARRMVRIWRYTKGACLTILKDHDDAIESLTFTNKDPILIFSGGEGAVIRQWERLQLNSFMYGRDIIDLKSYITGDDKKGKSLNRNRRIGFEDDHEFNIKLHEQMELLNSNTVRRLKRTLTLIGKNDHKPKQSKHIRKLIEGDEEKQTNQPSKVRKQYGLMKIEFYEPLDWLVCACEDSNLCKISLLISQIS
jgi:WD40 repeat protein